MSDEELPPDGRSDAEFAVLLRDYDPADDDSARRTHDALEPLIVGIASRVTAGRNDWRREDFLADVVTDLLAPCNGPPLVGRYDPARGSFVGWLFAVIRNMWRSANRRRETRTATVPFYDNLCGRIRPDCAAPPGGHERRWRVGPSAPRLTGRPI